ncbi:hypothetical protein [Ekhidna sp.]|uniref:hypothetical protein n=1 Tax=Ekhidna sp. TaxID=2608089 RepID=UPI0032999DCB
MKDYLTLLLILIALTSNSQDYRITPNSVGNINLGDSMNILTQVFPANSIQELPATKYGIDGPGNGYLIVINNSDTLMFVWSKDFDKTIGGIVCLSKAYRTYDGLGIGSTLGEIENKHPNVYQVPDYLDSSVEYVSVKYKSGNINFQVMSPRGTQVGNYEPNPNDEPSTQNFERKAKIKRMVIW